MGHVADRPDDDRESIAQPCADSVDDPAKADIAYGIGHLEPEHDVGEIALAPAEFGLQRRLEHADHLPVDIVDRRRRKQ
jgi:hypothetical protein